jgi:hypothetical protein
MLIRQKDMKTTIKRITPPNNPISLIENIPQGFRSRTGGTHKSHQI